MKTLLQVKEFMDKAHSITGREMQKTRSRVFVLDEEINAFRLQLIEDELDELRDALANCNNNPENLHNYAEVLDALCDIQYVLDGAFHAFGFAPVKEKAMDEVQRSNMSKLDDCTVRADGKILKGPKFSPPNLTAFVNEVL